MSADDRTLNGGQSEIDGEAARVESRRRLLQAGLIAVPFLVTLHSLPAYAHGGGAGSLGVYGYGKKGKKGGGKGDRDRRQRSDERHDRRW